MTTYEEILQQITAVPVGAGGHDRTTQWLTPAQVVGVARDHLGHLEVFLAGPRLQPRTLTLRDAIQFHSWHRDNAAPLQATRILLPAFGHFDQVGAFICTELLREGAEQNLERAFAVTEPIIELAIKRLELSKSSLLGLAGELLLLDALFRQADDNLVGQVAQSWDGWRRSARDFSWQGTGVEVKTTTRATSTHAVQGVHQIERAPATDEAPGEDRLLLVSVGLQQSEPSANSFSVPELVQRLVDRLQGTGNGGAVDDFLAHIAAYGSESGFGYHHATMSSDAPFTATFTQSFMRGYDMADAAVDVLRRDDILSHQHVDAQSVSFRINLPATINLENPIIGSHGVARAILRL